jgi:hypothetical protein
MSLEKMVEGDAEIILSVWQEHQDGRENGFSLQQGGLPFGSV